MAQLVLQLEEPLLLRLEHLGYGNARPLRHDLRDVLRVDLLLQVLPLLLDLGEPLLERLDFLLGRGHAPVTDLGSLLEITAARRLLGLRPQLLELGLLRLNLLDGILLGGPLRLHRVRPLAQLGHFVLDLLAPLFGGLVLLLGQRGQLDFELCNLALDFIDLLRQRVDRDPQPRGSLVDQVDRLVWQEPVGDIAMRQRRGRDQRVVGDANAVMDLVLLLETTENRDRVLDGRLAHVDRLEAPFECRVFLDVLAILIERRRADDVQLAARQRRLEHVRRIDGALGATRADERVQLVDEDDVAPLGRGNLLQHGLEPLLEFTAVLRARDERADVECYEMFVLE